MLLTKYARTFCHLPCWSVGLVLLMFVLPNGIMLLPAPMLTVATVSSNGRWYRRKRMNNAVIKVLVMMQSLQKDFVRAHCAARCSAVGTLDQPFRRRSSSIRASSSAVAMSRMSPRLTTRGRGVLPGDIRAEKTLDEFTFTASRVALATAYRYRYLMSTVSIHY